MTGLPLLDLRTWKHQQHFHTKMLNLDEYSLPDGLTPGLKKQYGQADFRSSDVFRAVREGRFRLAFDSESKAFEAFCSSMQGRFHVQQRHTCEALWESSNASSIWVKRKPSEPVALSQGKTTIKPQSFVPVVFAAHLH